MRFDHIVIHVEKDAQTLRALKETVNAQGYPYEPESGRRGIAMRSSQINIGDEYIEVVQLMQRGIRGWMPQWVSSYDAGKRGAYCLFFEAEDVERTAVALKKAGVAAQGPAVLTYPGLMGLLHPAAPYFFYTLPAFPGSHLQIALMEYNRPEDRTAALNALKPNAQRSGINGIRQVEIALPDLAASLPMLEQVFTDLQLSPTSPDTASLNRKIYEARAEKTRLVFSESANETAVVRLVTVTSQRSMLGKQFQVENVEVITSGG